MNNIRAKVTRPRPGIYSRGTETVNAILKAALHVLVEEGAPAFTLHRIATECGLKVGHVNHHFPRKEMLVEVLLEELILEDEAQIKSTMQKAGSSPEEILTKLIAYILDDLSTKRTTNLFTELWAMANHNDFVADRLEALHRSVHTHITELVMKINGSLSLEDARIVSIFIYGAMDGMTMFAGYRRPWAADMPNVKNVAIKGLIQIAKTIRPDDITTLPQKYIFS